MTDLDDLTRPLTIEMFDGYQDPEFALVKLREELLGRLEWLESALAPMEPSRSSPGSALMAKGILTRSALEGIQKILDASDPAQYGESVPRTAAAVVVEAGIAAAQGLDELIAATESKLEQLSPRARLLYRIAELPAPARVRIAKDLGLAIPREEGRGAAARALLGAATEAELLSQLWATVSEIERARLPGRNPFLQDLGEK